MVSRAKAIVSIDLWGHPGDQENLEMLAAAMGVPLIEDASQALGSSQSGRACGTFGTIGVLSFNVNKIITTGGGGALLTDAPHIAARARSLASNSKDQGNPWGFDHLEVGHNYRMPNICAAMAIPQVDRLGYLVIDRRCLAERYWSALEGIETVEPWREPEGCVSNYWLPVIRISDKVEGNPEGHVNDLVLALHLAGHDGRRAFTPLHRLDPYRPRGVEKPNHQANMLACEAVYRRTVCLPVRPPRGPL